MRSLCCKAYNMQRGAGGCPPELCMRTALIIMLALQWRQPALTRRGWAWPANSTRAALMVGPSTLYRAAHADFMTQAFLHCIGHSLERDGGRRRAAPHPSGIARAAEVHSKPSRCAAVATARAGKEGLRPSLRNLYQTRAQGYKDALQAFIEGYREGYIGESTARMQRESQDIMQQAAQVGSTPQH